MIAVVVVVVVVVVAVVIAVATGVQPGDKRRARQLRHCCLLAAEGGIHRMRAARREMVALSLDNLSAGLGAARRIAQCG
ncbi:hypothetical protein A6456_14805 [Paraburkholderia tropica]|nr:hypothetical protein A6456_14805 [Paraburkholderia tropica]